MGLASRVLVGFIVAVVGQAGYAEPIEYDCDTPGGNYSEIALNQDGDAHRIRGTITPLELRPTRKWSPAATIYFQSQDERYTAGIQLMNASGKTLDVIVITAEGGQTKKATAGQVRTKDAVPFDLYIPSSGESFAEVLGKRVPLGFSVGANAKLSITCSSGHFSFERLNWGWQPRF